MRLSALGGLPDDAPITDRVQPPLRPAGAGESPAEVLGRLPEDQMWIPVLVNGRCVAVLPRSAVQAIVPAPR